MTAGTSKVAVVFDCMVFLPGVARPDPADEPYINLAIASRADYLVSRDADILALADEANPDNARLMKFAPKLRMVDPVTFLREMRKSQMR